jgi:serine protease Do
MMIKVIAKCWHEHLLNTNYACLHYAMTRTILNRFSHFLFLSIIVLAAFQPARADEPRELSDKKTNATRQKKSINAKKLSEAFRAAAEQALPSVVTVYARHVEEKNGKLSLDLEDIPGFGEDLAESDQIGSGVILSEDGLIVTNHHVVEDCNRVLIRFPDGRQYEGHDIRSDKGSDLAILTIKAPKKLPAIRLGDSDSLAVGDWVLAIGSPFAIEQTVSAGIISGKGRGMQRLLAGQLLQTDAAINPGNSGGALLNLDGELVGINSAIASTSGEFQGVGFAIPINRVKWITSELRSNGKVRRAFLGLTSVPVPAEIAEQYDLPLPSAAFVLRIRDGFPAEQAGVQKNDIILKLADQTVKSPADLNGIVEQLPIGPSFPMIVLRDGEQLKLSITLQAKPTPGND